MAELLSWQVVLPTILGLIGLGFLVVYAMRDRVDANWAILFFLSAAAYWVLKLTMWAIGTAHSFTFRFLACFAGIGLAGAFVVEAVRLVNRKHDEQQKLQPVQSVPLATQATPPPPPTPTPSPSASPLPSLSPARRAAQPKGNSELERRRQKALRDLNLKDDPE